jgi:GTPase SAR1 family protein
LIKSDYFVDVFSAIVILLVGNKKDLEEEREVTFLEASR